MHHSFLDYHLLTDVGRGSSQRCIPQNKLTSGLLIQSRRNSSASITSPYTSACNARCGHTTIFARASTKGILDVCPHKQITSGIIGHTPMIRANKSSTGLAESRHVCSSLLVKLGSPWSDNEKASLWYASSWVLAIEPANRQIWISEQKPWILFRAYEGR